MNFRRALLSISLVNEKFEIISVESFTGKFFYCTSYFNDIQVFGTWSIIEGNQYASINSNGKVTINEGVINQDITIQCVYDEFTETKEINISYDNQLTIESESIMRGTSGNVIAKYNSQVIIPTWSITEGNLYGNIDSTGNITIVDTGNITISAVYNNYTTTKTIHLIYEQGKSTQTEVDEETGAVTVTNIETTTNIETGEVTENAHSITTNDDGSVSNSSTTTTTAQDGSSTSRTVVSNQDGSSSISNSETSAPDVNGTTTTSANTTNYDENGNITGTSELERTDNSDGSSSATTINYDENGDPTDQQNVDTDVIGNIDTQDIEYENGEPIVVGYDIDTTASEGEGKEIEGNGVNTEFVPFKFASEGFVLHIVFKTIAQEQPRPPITADTEDSSSNYLYNIFGAKATAKIGNAWPGFEVRWIIPKSNPNWSNTKAVQLQFCRTLSGESTTSRTDFTSGCNENNVYDLTVTYNPALNNTNRFVVRNNITNSNIQAVNKSLQNNLDLDLTIGYGVDHNGNQIRHGNLIVYEFSVSKLS